jgi:Protein of unknown function (DUF2505)
VQLTATIEYSAEPGRVFAMLTDQAFQEEVCRATGALKHEVGIEDSADGGVTITTSRTLPSDPLPDFVRKFAGETLTVRRVDRWGPAADDGSRDGTVVVEITGTPVRLTGRITLAADGDGAREQVGGDLKAAIPFIGGKVEKAAQAPILAAIDKEQEVGTDWLAR